MIYSIITTDKFDKAFKKLDYATQKIIKKWIDKNLSGCEDPRIHGKALVGNKSGYWRYRIGDYRMITEIIDQECIIIAVEIAHRREVYSREL